MKQMMLSPTCLPRPLQLFAALVAGGACSLVQPVHAADPPARAASGTIRIENPQDKATLATRIDEAIQRAKERNAAQNAPGARRPAGSASPIPSVQVHVPADKPRKPSKAEAAPPPPPPPRPAVADPGASRRYIQSRAAELAATIPPPPPPDPRTVKWDHGSGEKGPQAWGGLHPDFAACSQGTRQSPIHITAKDIAAGPADPLPFAMQPFGGTVWHTGHGLELEVDGTNVLPLRGAPWRLLRLAFRHPAEERVHHQAWPMATELVYQGPNGQMAVVTVPMQLGSPSPFIQRIWTHMPLDAQDRVRLPQPVLSLAELLPQDRRYYQYAGSVTQPPCTEGVLRIVMKTPVNVGLDQLRLLQRVSPPNARPVQAANGRLVREAQ